MARSRSILRRLVSAWHDGPASEKPRRPRRAEPRLDPLEGRVVLSHFGFSAQRLSTRLAAVARANQTGTSSTSTTTGSLVTGDSGGGCSHGAGAVQDAQ